MIYYVCKLKKGVLEIMAQVNLLDIDMLDIGRHVYMQDVVNPEIRAVYVVYARKNNTVYLYNYQNPSLTLEVEFKVRQRYGFFGHGCMVDAIIHQITGEVLWLNPVLNETELP